MVNMAMVDEIKGMIACLADADTKAMFKAQLQYYIDINDQGAIKRLYSYLSGEL